MFAQLFSLSSVLLSRLGCVFAGSDWSSFLAKYDYTVLAVSLDVAAEPIMG